MLGPPLGPVLCYENDSSNISAPIRVLWAQQARGGRLRLEANDGTWSGLSNSLYWLLMPLVAGADAPCGAWTSVRAGAIVSSGLVACCTGGFCTPKSSGHEWHRWWRLPVLFRERANPNQMGTTLHTPA